MADFLPPFILVALFIIGALFVGYILGKNYGHACSGSDMPTPPLQVEPVPSCQQYVLCVQLKHGVDEQFAWDTIEKIYTNRPDNILVIRLRNRVEHTYTNAIKYRVYPATGVEDWMYWEEYKKENKEE